MGVLNCPRHFVITELTIVVCSALLCGERVLLVGVGGGGVRVRMLLRSFGMRGEGWEGQLQNNEEIKYYFS